MLLQGEALLQQLSSLLDVTDSCCLAEKRSESLQLAEAVTVHRTRAGQETHPLIVDNGSFLTGCFVGAEVLLDAPVTSPETAHTLLAPGTMTEKQLLRQPGKGQPPSL